MLDAALIDECADPSLKPAIVEQFVQAVGSDDPLAITVRTAGRLILVPKPKTPAEAIEIVRENTERSNVRVGLTQFPAAVGLTDTSELKPHLFEPCSNLRIGTAMFARILRIVARWYGNPTARRSSLNCSMMRCILGGRENSRAKTCFGRRIREERSSRRSKGSQIRSTKAMARSPVRMNPLRY